MSEDKDRVLEEKEKTQKTLDKINVESSKAETYRKPSSEDEDCMDRVDEAKKGNQDKIDAES
mgnify:CR=1 FL=1